MKAKTRHCDPHRGERSFIVADTIDGHVHVREWDMLSPARAEEVADVEMSPAEYARVVASCDGDEGEACRTIIADARRQAGGRGLRLVRLVNRGARHDAEPPHEAAG